MYGRRFILVTDHKPLLALFGPHKATPALAANRLARWALMLSQYEYTIEYRKTAAHGNADSLSRLPVRPDDEFDKEEEEDNTHVVNAINTVSLQLKATDPELLAKESAKDPVISTVMRYVNNGWIDEKDTSGNEHYSIDDFKKIETSLSTSCGCLLYGARLVIPHSLQQQVLKLLHLGHFGIQRMKQLARTAVYWPRIDYDIVDTCHKCYSCAQHQNDPPKQLNHPWMLPERPWSRVHINHAINFMGRNWLLLTDAFSKYPCIHPRASLSTKATIDILEKEFAHFGYPHTVVSDNAATFKSDEFQNWCRERGIIHLTGAPYHPGTNGAVERLVQTFKKALKKSELPPLKALQEFLMLYRRTPLPCGYSPSELLMERQIRAKIDTFMPSPAHILQRRQRVKQQETHKPETMEFKIGTSCYARKNILKTRKKKNGCQE